MRINNYSVLNTKTNIRKKNSYKILDKKFSFNVRGMTEKKIVKKVFLMIKKYYSQILESGINIPKIENISLRSNKIVCSMNYEGKNLIEKKFNYSNVQLFSKYLDKIFEIIKLAKKNKIKIDPHIKNFVINSQDQVFYVDIFPPYCKEYETLRELFYQTEEEKKICNQNFTFFNSSNLFYHFVSDIIKIDTRFHYKIDFFYKKLRKIKAINSSKSFFKKKVIQIMKIEKLRIKKKYFLV